MRIGFTGHQNKIAHDGELERIHRQYPGAMWVHGGAGGFDTQVHIYAEAHGIPVEKIRPDYKRYRSIPKYAPLARDEVIVDTTDRLVACFDGRPVGGTKYTVDYALRQGKPVEYVNYKSVEMVSR